MFGGSSSEDRWSTLLEPAALVDDNPRRPDDPRLAEIIEMWTGDPAALQPGRRVLIGFPQEEGVRRNGGRLGTRQAPREIRRWLGRLVPYDSKAAPLLDLGDVRIDGSLEDSQQALGRIVAAVLDHEAIPIVLGGGHETAYGHYLGYAMAQRQVGIINLDAHLDVRPLIDDVGHSGSPFRQAIGHAAWPLPGSRYICIGAQPHAVARAHLHFAAENGCIVRWCDQVRGKLKEELIAQLEQLAARGCRTYVTIDADVARQADVPGVSAPNPSGLDGTEIITAARAMGESGLVASLDLVEICPPLDRDGQSARWAALVVWNFLAGLAGRERSSS